MTSYNRIASTLKSGQVVRTRPFYIFTLTPFLEPRLYRELCATFPDRKWFSDRAAGNKLRLNARKEPEVFERFLLASQAWRRLIAFLSSKDFLTEVHTYVKPHLSHARGFGQSRAWFLDGVRIGSGLFPQKIRMNFEFSRLERGSSVPAHTDAPQKIVSIILFFPDSTWEKEYGGGTVFYRPKKERFEHNWFNRKTPLYELTPFFECPFKPNQFLLFLKSKNSYHGVDPLTSPEGLPRNSLNVNVFAEMPERSAGLAEWRRRLRKRLEQRH